jgi:hypothetical protein
MKMLAIAIASAAATAALAQQPVTEEPVPVRVSNLSQHVRERVQSHADQGITSLARYLEVSRTVHQLRLMDVVLGIDAWGYAGDNDSIDRQIESQVREKNRARTVK